MKANLIDLSDLVMSIELVMTNEVIYFTCFTPKWRALVMVTLRP